MVLFKAREDLNEHRLQCSARADRAGCDSIVTRICVTPNRVWALLHLGVLQPALVL